MSSFTHFDKRFMRRAITLAKRGIGAVAPNPLVGCVIVKDQKVISEGYHQFRGSYHAEVNAIIRAAKEELDGATLYCTLEPCCHSKKLTGPCTEAIKRHPFKRIVVGSLDPNPAVSGKGIEALRLSGYHVDTGLLADECEQLNHIFKKNIIKSMPYILLKAAITLDGKIANSANQSQWITDEQARVQAHLLRKQCGSIMIGRGTLEKDNPSLTIRHVFSSRGMKRILLADISKFEQKVTEYQLFKDQSDNPTIVITSEENLRHENVNILKDLGAKLIFFGPMGPLSENVFSELYELGVHAILVEGGAQLISSLVRTGNYDELCLFVAPFMIGNGMSFYDNPDVIDINEIPRLRLESSEKIGDQMLLRYTR